MSALNDLRQTVARLRAPEGCPWDREQTHESLIPCLIEECSEVIEAVDHSDYPLLREELGDLLLSVVMHAQIAEESHLFDIEEVAQEINAKLIRRHPHVFGPEAGAMSTEEVLHQWEKIKTAEKADKGIIEKESFFKKLPPRLPASYFATEACKRMRKKNIPISPYVSQPDYLPQEESEMADLLLASMAQCQKNGWDPEKLLRQKTDQLIEEVEKNHPLNSHEK